MKSTIIKLTVLLLLVPSTVYSNENCNKDSSLTQDTKSIESLAKSLTAPLADNKIKIAIKGDLRPVFKWGDGIREVEITGEAFLTNSEEYSLDFINSYIQGGLPSSAYPEHNVGTVSCDNGLITISINKNMLSIFKRSRQKIGTLYDHKIISYSCFDK